MPRRNRLQKPTIRLLMAPGHPEASKRRYPSKLAAERAAEVQMLQTPGLELFVYKASNNGWYLTRRQLP